MILRFFWSCPLDDERSEIKLAQSNQFLAV
jgi:hypothetical protein